MVRVSVVRHPRKRFTWTGLRQCRRSRIGDRPSSGVDPPDDTVIPGATILVPPVRSSTNCVARNTHRIAAAGQHL